jgi:RES domain-containing protein
MPTLWRISNYVDLSGFGGEKFASRWTSLGKRVVYMAESPPGALLEILVHLQLEDDEWPDDYQLLEIEVPESIDVRDLMPNPKHGWRERPNTTQRIGDTWLSSLHTPLGRVPSAIVPRTSNLLLNPLHPDASKLKVVSVIHERFDTRLFKPNSH